MLLGIIIWVGSYVYSIFTICNSNRVLILKMNVIKTRMYRMNRICHKVMSDLDDFRRLTITHNIIWHYPRIITCRLTYSHAINFSTKTFLRVISENSSIHKLQTRNNIINIHQSPKSTIFYTKICTHYTRQNTLARP